jgi:hypothetical protein
MSRVVVHGRAADSARSSCPRAWRSLGFGSPRHEQDLTVSIRANGESTPQIRPRPELKRVWASLERSPESVIKEMFEEAHFRDPQRDKNWVALVDGNKPQIRFLRQNARKQKVDLTVVLDFIHVTEYVWSAGLAFHVEATPELEAWVA